MHLLQGSSDRIRDFTGSGTLATRGLSFDIHGAGSTVDETPTGLREDVLLLSWLIALLRIQPDEEVSFDWRYPDLAAANDSKPNRLSSRTILSEALQESVAEARKTISEYMRWHGYQASARSTKLTSLLLDNCCQTGQDGNRSATLSLEVRYCDNRVRFQPQLPTGYALPFTAEQYIHNTAVIFDFCLRNPDTPIRETFSPTSWDLDQLWRWNCQLPPTYRVCMHDIISTTAQTHAQKVAISAWDGDLTYAQIDAYSSRLALKLQSSGVNNADVVPVCFEKSRWTVVAVLAVMKSGATFAMMDPTLPPARLQNMAGQIGAKLLISSAKQHDFSQAILPNGNILVLDQESIPLLDLEDTSSSLMTVDPDTLMYIIFTSGSTGTPKGVKISHQTYSSSAFPRAKTVGYTEDTRVLDFASYAFDVSIDSMILTLANGGCLCIPSDEDRMNDINGVIRNMRITYAGLTPSVARVLDGDLLEQLDMLGLGGEAVAARDVAIWGQSARIVIGYGPCECTIGCTINGSAATGRDYISIGPGNGAAMWVVDPDDHNCLLPVGAVGELLVEGPIVGQGYLDDPEKTRAAFIESPPWLVAGHSGQPGRRSRLYKTGDLGKYDPDGSGSIVFAGRKDTQVKLRGQRIELGEIESQLRDRLPAHVNVVAEVITPEGAGNSPTLVVFLADQAHKLQDLTTLELVQPSEQLSGKISSTDQELKDVLPRYMLPSAYIPVSKIPVLISGKTDRKQLRQFGATVKLNELDRPSPGSNDQSLSAREKRLRLSWSLVLALDEDAIQSSSNFFNLGGDSLIAMKLVTAGRANGLGFTVATVFRHPTLSAMANETHESDVSAQLRAPAFSMVPRKVQEVREEAGRACASHSEAIEDIYPCTPTQESLFTFSLKSSEAYVAQRVAAVPSNVDLNALRQAWEHVVTETPILRTRLVQLYEPGLQQVVVRGDIVWQDETSLARYLEMDRNKKMELGQWLTRYALVHDKDDNKHYMIWTAHHVVYDGWSEPMILQKVNGALHGMFGHTAATFRDFVHHLRTVDRPSMEQFWRQELAGAVGAQFPRLPSRDYLPNASGRVDRSVSLQIPDSFTFTTATVIRSAWALVASRHTGNDDVIFGETLSGRDVSLPNVEDIIGPLIATVPVRLRISSTTTTKTLLNDVQHAMLNRIPYQHMGMQNIRRVSQDAQHACESATGIVIQPESTFVETELGIGRGDAVSEALHFNPYPLMLAFGLQEGGYRVCASFDTDIISVHYMERMLAEVEAVSLQIIGNTDSLVRDISCLSEAELDQVWGWNKSPPLSFDATLGKLCVAPSTEQGSRYPNFAVPWVCDARNPALLCPIDCVGELWLEGAFLPGEAVESPNWLLAGSPTHKGRAGRIVSTGDLVRLRGNGELEYVARKNDLSALRPAINLAELDFHVAKYLPAGTHAGAVKMQSSFGNDKPSLRDEILIIVEQPESIAEGGVRILDKPFAITYDIPNIGPVQSTVRHEISEILAHALKRLEKSCRDQLPSYMIPSGYIVISKFPPRHAASENASLNHLAAHIDSRVLVEVLEGLRVAWSSVSTSEGLSANEDILRTTWAEILGITPVQIDVDDNFFRLGGDSVLAMKLVSKLRSQGFDATVADVFKHMRLGDAARVLQRTEERVSSRNPYERFSALQISDAAEYIRRELAIAEWNIEDVCPATESQALDVRATIDTPRTSFQYTTLYLDQTIDRTQLLRAWHELVKAHEILRTVFVEADATMYQVVLQSADIPVFLHDTKLPLQQAVDELCHKDAEKDFHLGSLFHRIFHVQGDDGRQCLVIGLSHSHYDGLSLPQLLQDLSSLYCGTDLDVGMPFPEYIALTQDRTLRTNAINYWTSLLTGSSLSVLDTVPHQDSDRAVFQSKVVATPDQSHGFTEATVLLAAWALLLARHTRSSDVTFGNITTGRAFGHSGLESVMGPCYRFTPVRVQFDPGWTATDLLRFVQQQSAESAVYDFLGFGDIAGQCATWGDEKFFNSIVHYQPAGEDFEVLPFGNGSCRVDAIKPHGDAARPVKAVSFIKNGQTHVGMVGSESNPGFVQSMVDALAETFTELASPLSSHPIILDETPLPIAACLDELC